MVVKPRDDGNNTGEGARFHDELSDTRERAHWESGHQFPGRSRRVPETNGEFPSRILDGLSQ